MPWYKPSHSKGDKMEYHVGAMSPVRSELRDGLRQHSNPGGSLMRPSTGPRPSSGAPAPVSTPHALQLGHEGAAYREASSSLLERVYELRAGGADLVLDLPMVVVAGQQSAGKSSVVEALCGIPLPRKCDTCTRCPTEVRLISRPHHDTPAAWSVTIKLRTHGPHPATSPAPGGDRPGSSAGVHETVFASGLPTPASVEAAVAAAQAALLGGDPSTCPSNANSSRPLTPSGIYPSVPKAAPGDPPHAGFTAAASAAAAAPPLLKFTRDVVVVEVWGAPVDLCLVDLPGLIANVEAPEDAHYRGLVEGLVRGYASRPGALICAVVTCKEDIDTQPVLSLARECDPTGRRTLGVLTKPDQIEEGCHEQWMAVLGGTRYPLGLGYYVLRCPSAADLAAAAAAAPSPTNSNNSSSHHARPHSSNSATGQCSSEGQAAGGGLDHAASRAREASFFSSVQPWCGALPGLVRRLGAGALREALCRQLTALLEAARPSLLAAALQQLMDARSALAALPHPGGRRLAGGGGAGAAVVELIEAVTQPLREEVAGSGPDKSFYQSLLVVYQSFQRSLAATRPVFVVGPAATLPSPAAAAATSQLQLPFSSLGIHSNSSSEPGTPSRAGLASHCLSPGCHSHVVVTCTVESDLEVAIAAAGEAAGLGMGSSGSSTLLQSGRVGLGVLLGSTGSSSSGRGAGSETGAAEGCVLVPTAPVLSGVLLAHQVLLPPSAATAPGALSLGDVAGLVGSLLSRELPGFSPYEALQVLVGRHQGSWCRAAAACLEAARSLLGERVEAAVGRSCRHLPAAAEAIRRVAEELLSEVNEAAAGSVSALIQQELSMPFTVHRLEFALLKQQHLASLEAHHAAACAAAAGAAAASSAAAADSSSKGGGGFLGRGGGNKGGSNNSSGVAGRMGSMTCGQEGPGLPAHIAALTEALGGPLSMYSVDGGNSSSSSGRVMASDATSSSGSGQQQQQQQPGLSASGTSTGELLSLMAACLAYWGLSYRRLADVVPLLVSHHLVTGVTRELRGRLAGALLGAGAGEAALAALLAEEPGAAAQRAALEGRVALLEKAVGLLRRP